MRLVVTGLVMILMSGFAWGEESDRGILADVAKDNETKKSNGPPAKEVIVPLKLSNDPKDIKEARKFLQDYGSKMAVIEAKIEEAKAQLDEANQSLFSSSGTKQALSKKIDYLQADLKSYREAYDTVSKKFEGFEAEQIEATKDPGKSALEEIKLLKNQLSSQEKQIARLATQEKLDKFGNRLSSAERDLRQMKNVLSLWQNDPCSLIRSCGAKGNQAGAAPAAPAAPQGVRK